MITIKKTPSTHTNQSKAAGLIYLVQAHSRRWDRCYFQMRCRYFILKMWSVCITTMQVRHKSQQCINHQRLSLQRTYREQQLGTRAHVEAVQTVGDPDINSNDHPGAPPLFTSRSAIARRAGLLDAVLFALGWCPCAHVHLFTRADMSNMQNSRWAWLTVADRTD